MALPTTNPFGLLPVGRHRCSLEEAIARFGSVFRHPDRAPYWDRVQACAVMAKHFNIWKEMIVDDMLCTDAPCRGVVVAFLTPESKITHPSLEMAMRRLDSEFVKPDFHVKHFIAGHNDSEMYSHLEEVSPLKLGNVKLPKIPISLRKGFLTIPLDDEHLATTG